MKYLFMKRLIYKTEYSIYKTEYSDVTLPPHGGKWRYILN